MVIYTGGCNDKSIGHSGGVGELRETNTIIIATGNRSKMAATRDHQFGEMFIIRRIRNRPQFRAHGDRCM